VSYINATSSVSQGEYFLNKFRVVEIYVSLLLIHLIVFEDESIKMFGYI
jgi:hypothetical protein